MIGQTRSSSPLFRPESQQNTPPKQRVINASSGNMSQHKRVSISDAVQVTEIESTVDPMELVDKLLRKGYRNEMLNGKPAEAVQNYTEAINILRTTYGENPENEDQRDKLALAFCRRGCTKGRKEIRDIVAARADLAQADALDTSDKKSKIPLFLKV